MTYDVLFEFERRLQAFTGAPYVIATDSCTHAIELCLRHDRITECSFTPYTYISVPMIMHRLGIQYRYLDHQWQHWIGEYQFIGTRIWDSARRLESNMYRSGQIQCLSFGPSKPLHLGRVGAILTDDEQFYKWASLARSDGRNLHLDPWQDQKTFDQGWHYCPSLELCSQGIKQLDRFVGAITDHKYPDCRLISISNHD